MRAIAGLGLLLLCVGALHGAGGSPQAWAGGTQAWDTTPYHEMDLGLHWAGADGRPAYGADIQWGIVDPLQAGLSWEQPVDAGWGNGELRLQWREDVLPSWRPGLGLLGRLPYDGRAFHAGGGLVAGLEPWGWSLVGNAEAYEGGDWVWRAGLWTPYLLWFSRLGLDLSSLKGAAPDWSPQLCINLPGDISLLLGATVQAAAATTRYSLRLSYEIFPSP